MCGKAFKIAKNPKYNGYQQGPASIIYKFFHKNTSDGAGKNENMSNKDLTEELHKPIIRKFEKSYIRLLQIIFGVLILPIWNY